MNIQAFGPYVILNKVKDTQSIGGIEMVSALDDQNRYIKGVVFSASKDVPLKEGDKIYYDKQNSFGIMIDNSLHQVVLMNNIIGKVEE